MPFLEKEMAVAAGDHGTDFYVAFCTRTKFIAVVVLKIHWTSRSKDSKDVFDLSKAGDTKPSRKTSKFRLHSTAARRKESASGRDK